MVDDPVVDERGDNADNRNRKPNPQNISHRGGNHTDTTVVWGRRERNMLSLTAGAGGASATVRAAASFGRPGEQRDYQQHNRQSAVADARPATIAGA